MKLSEKQKEILELAKDMFAERGYVETSMRDLAFQADIKAASLYSHFKSKDQILSLICDEVYDLMRANMSFINNSNFSIEEKFLTYIKIHIESIIFNTKSYDIYNKYWSLLDQDMVGKYGLMNYQYIDFIKSLINQMFPHEVQLDCYIPDATVLFFVNLLNSVPKLVNREKLDLDCVVKDVQYRLIYGFKKDM